MRYKRFKISTFNLYNLVLPGVIYYDNKKYSKNMYEKKLRWLGRQIDHLDADIIGFQEIFHQEALQVAIDKSSLKNPTVIVEGETGQKPVVGLASVFEVLEAQSITEIPPQAQLALEKDEEGLLTVDIPVFSRPILKAKLKVYDREMVVFVAHLKSKRPEFLPDEDNESFMSEALASIRSLIRRSVEAAGLRALVLEEIAETNTPVIVLGDLNDNGEAVTTRVISGEPPWIGAKFWEKKATWDRLLYNATELLARRTLKNSDYSHIHNGHYELLDHIFVSQEFYLLNPYHIGQVEYVRFLNDHLLDGEHSSTSIPKWKSDHAQVVATIKLRDTVNSRDISRESKKARGDLEIWENEVRQE